MGQVPNTNTFSLWDVVDAIGLMSGSSLTDCFTASISAGFDPAYVGSKDRLSNFRNYNHDIPYISITPTSRSFRNAGGSFTITVSSNAAWTSSVSDSWISRTPTTGTGNTSVTVTVAANGSGMARLGWISFSISGTTVTCTINQDA